VKNVVPKVMWHHTDPNYLHRLTPLFYMAVMAETFSGDVVKAHFLPVLKALSKDRVANIRMNVAKSIQSLGQSLKSQQQSGDTAAQLKSILNDLKTDEDGDVRYYSLRALSAI